MVMAVVLHPPTRIATARRTKAAATGTASFDDGLIRNSGNSIMVASYDAVSARWDVGALSEARVDSLH